MSHLPDQFHVFLDLGLVFRFGASKLEIDHDKTFAVAHHAVRPPFHDMAVVIGRKNGTFIIKRPRWREPCLDATVLSTLAQHVFEACRSNLLVVDDTFLFQFQQGTLYIVNGANGREHMVEHITHLDV